MASAKILVPDIADCASFALDEEAQYAFVSGYGITLKDDVSETPKYILGLLNSKVLDFYLKQVSTTLRGGFFRYFTQFIEQLPIHTIDFSNPEEKIQHDKLVSLVDIMLILNKQKQAIFTLFQDLIKKFDQDSDLRSLNDYYTTERPPSLDDCIDETEKRYSTNRYTMNIVKSTEHIDHQEAGRVVKVECDVEDSYLVLKVKLEGEDEFKRFLDIYFEDTLLKEFFVLSIKSYLAKNERKRYWSKEKIWEALVEIMIPRSVPNEIADVRNIKRLVRTLGEVYNDMMEDEFKDSPVKELDLCGIEKMIEDVDSEIDQKVYELYGLTAEEIEIVERSVHHE